MRLAYVNGKSTQMLELYLQEVDHFNLISFFWQEIKLVIIF